MACRKCESIDYHSDDDGTWDYEENPTYHLMKHCSTCQSREALKERKEQQEYENAMENEVALARMKITNVINMHNGASLKPVNIKNVPLKNKNLFLNAARALDIDFVGIDFISPDIYVNYDKNDGKILELNTAPDIEIHLEHMKKNSFYNKIVKLLQ